MAIPFMIVLLVPENSWSWDFSVELTQGSVFFTIKMLYYSILFANNVASFLQHAIYPHLYVIFEIRNIDRYIYKYIHILYV